MQASTLAWLMILLAGALEVAWAAMLPRTEGWTRLWPSLVTAGLLVASLYLLSLGVRTLPVGTAYAVWTGIGAVGTAVVGMTLLGEPVTAGRVGCIALIVAGIVGLKVLS